MRRTLTILLLVALLAAVVTGAAASTSLSLHAAKHALRVDLAHGYGIHHVGATCRRRSRVKFTCRWSGRRSGKGYAGRATVARAGRSTSVQLTNVHRT